jgi:hypothetical protein
MYPARRGHFARRAGASERLMRLWRRTQLWPKSSANVTTRVGACGGGARVNIESARATGPRPMMSSSLRFAKMRAPHACREYVRPTASTRALESQSPPTSAEFATSRAASSRRTPPAACGHRHHRSCWSCSPSWLFTWIVDSNMHPPGPAQMGTHHGSLAGSPAPCRGVNADDQISIRSPGAPGGWHTRLPSPLPPAVDKACRHPASSAAATWPVAVAATQTQINLLPGSPVDTLLIWPRNRSPRSARQRTVNLARQPAG